MKVYAMHLTGRCRSGGDSTGTVNHAVRPGNFAALCGKTYGKHSAGWSDYLGTIITCPKCVNIIKASGEHLEIVT